MSLSTLQGDYYFPGAVRIGTLVIPDSAVGDQQFNAADPLTAAKQQHQYVEKFTQASGSNAAAETRVVHHAHAGGTVAAVHVGSVVAATGNSTVTVDVKKNGTTILSSTIVLDNGNTAYVSEAGTVSVSSYIAGDTFTVVVSVSAGSGTLPQGLFVAVVFREDAG